MSWEKTKDELLEEARHERKRAQMFTQYDAFVGRGGSKDHVMRPDDDGDVMFSGSVCDLRACGPDLAVRVQVHYDASAGDVLRAVDKLRDWIERDLGGVDPSMTIRELQSIAQWDPLPF